MFASLPPGSRLPRHRDPYAGSLRFHMGLITPNSPDCYINVDGETYYWRDGEAVVFDETFIGSSCSPTSSVRCAFAGPRPSTAWWAASCCARRAPGRRQDRRHQPHLRRRAVRRVGKALKKRSQPLYYLTKWLLVGGLDLRGRPAHGIRPGRFRAALLSMKAVLSGDGAPPFLPAARRSPTRPLHPS